MCIIVAKPKGVKLPKKEILSTCFENNPDGAGIMFTKNDQVRILKGFMTFDDFIRGLNKVKKICKSDLTDKSIVMHFRIGTHGKNDKATTHPFPITSNYDDLRKTDVTNSLGLAHNGVISSYCYSDILSDTQAFVKDFMTPLKNLDRDFYKHDDIKKIILKIGGYSKFAILDNKDHISILGDFIKDEKTGIYYSNGTYQTSRYKWNYESDYYTREYTTNGRYTTYEYTYKPKAKEEPKTDNESVVYNTLVQKNTKDNKKHTKSIFGS